MSCPACFRSTNLTSSFGIHSEADRFFSGNMHVGPSAYHVYQLFQSPVLTATIVGTQGTMLAKPEAKTAGYL